MENRLRLKIWNDNTAPNPFLEWDCEPSIVFQNTSGNLNDISNGEIADFIRDRLTVEIVKPKKKELSDITGVCLENYEDLTEEDIVDNLIDDIDFLSVDQMSEVLDLFDLPHLNFISTGYSQGDWANVLIVATDEFFERTGARRDKTDIILSQTRDLFNSWIWGDVFGFTVEEGAVVEIVDKNTKEVIREEVDWNTKDSCGGFFGKDFKNNGMSDYVPEELHEDLKNFDYNDIEYNY